MFLFCPIMFLLLSVLFFFNNSEQKSCSLFVHKSSFLFNNVPYKEFLFPFHQLMFLFCPIMFLLLSVLFFFNNSQQKSCSLFVHKCSFLSNNVPNTRDKEISFRPFCSFSIIPKFQQKIFCSFLVHKYSYIMFLILKIIK